MKRILLLICCLGVLCAARGQTRLHYWFDGLDSAKVTIPLTETNQLNTQLDVNGLTEGVHSLYLMVENAEGELGSPIQRTFVRTMSFDENRYYRCWFDNDESTAQTGKLADGAIMLDVANLSDGLHTVFVQAYGNFVTSPQSYQFLKVPNVVGNEELTYICLIDDQLYTQQTVPGTQEVIHLDMDVAPLSQGVHKLQIMLATESGAVTGAYTSYFYRAILQTEITEARLVYMVDGKEQPAASATSATNGTLHYDLDVSSLSNGLHSINYALVGSGGVYGTGTTQWFYKIPIGGEGLVSYEYWLNDDEANMHHVDLAEHVSAYHLVSLLPVDKVPVRSSLFQFAFKNDTIPVAYAKNDFHVRFWESGGSYAMADAQYVDERACDTVHADTLKAKNIINAPKKDTIYWYCVQAKAGDSLSIKTNKACDLHIFSPSAEEVYRADATQSVSWGGCHANKKGIYYIALHDYKADSLPSITLYSQHIDRYAVLSQNVNRVGNGGFSTITYEGNGFDSLDSVYLVNAYGNTISSEHISHESNTKTSIAFDFTDVMLGEYDAVFVFTDEELYLDENITVEEPIDIVLTSSVDYPSTYLQGETVTYELTITNEGNMTAYDVPIFMYIATPSINDISKIKIEGLEIDNILAGVELDFLPESYVKQLRVWANEFGDDHYFFKFITDSHNDTICVRANYFFANISPYETKHINIHITATSSVDVWCTSPKNYNAITLDPTIERPSYAPHKRVLQTSSIMDYYCCAKDHVECALNVVAGILDVSSLFASGWVSAADCGVSVVKTTMEGIGAIGCNDGSFNAASAGKVAKSAVSALLSCAADQLSRAGNFYKDYKEIESMFKTAASILSGTVVGMDILEGNETYKQCKKAFTQPKPDCPPGDPKGGKSDPVDPSDPNDIRGYTSESGSRYMRQEIETIHYEIEYENDTALATAPAHTIIVRDTLDATRFDLASFAATEITIGDRKMKWETPQGGPQTLDMRTRMNVIAQVQLDYSDETGIAQWTITSLDPMTMEPITEPDLGVLPVNFDGNGMGTISYRINLKNHFDDGTQIANRASIIFDNNQPILTPVWINTVDAVSPTSEIVKTDLVSDSLTFCLNTADSRSGVWRRDVYARINTEDEWQVAAQSATDTVVVTLTDGWRQFYVLAVDSAGNIETKTPNPEYSLVLDTYLITFYDEDGTTVLDAREWDYGMIPSCEIPRKEADQLYRYEFDQWIPALAPVTTEAAYTASYKALPLITTDLQDVLEKYPSAQKLLRDGQLLILRGDKIYTATGQEVR